ncbi:MAG TPA: ARMT1-like domain-containing protein [Bacteroidales bacterium]|nr:ARMT1-like domain-containing protein [Bacteroidales bacterium]
MVSDYRCFFCFTRAFEKLLEKEKISIEAKNAFTLDMIRLYQENGNSFSAPCFSRELHSILRRYTHNPDPYKEEKKENNDQALSLFHESEKLIKQSNDPFSTSLRIAIAGNIIDFAANDNFNILVTIEKALNSEFAIDHSKQLKKALESANSVLYLGDNAGEIVFDKLFIQTINHPNLTYVVRGAPVINDATMEDAEYVGMKEITNVISNGFDAPSTIPDKSNRQFQQYFREADLIISKGQGNLEGLIPLIDDRIFFLFMAKCDVIAEFMKVKKDSFVVYNEQCVKTY